MRILRLCSALVLLAATASAQNTTITSPRFMITTGPCVLIAGSGSPEGVVTGKPCDTYWRSDASVTNPPVYVKWSGTGNTGWHAVPGLTRANTWTADQTISANLMVSGSTSLGSMGAGAYALTIAPSWTGTWTGTTWINRNTADTQLRSEWYVDANSARITSYTTAGGGAYRPLDIYANPTRILSGGVNVGGTSDPGDGNVWLNGGAIQNQGYVSQTTGWRVTAAGAGDFRYLFTDELHAKSFIADMEQALAGGQVISKSVAVLAANFTAPNAGNAATLVVKDLQGAAGLDVFAVGDLIRLRTFARTGDGPPSMTIADCWGTVGTATHNGDGTQTYTYTRSAAIPGGMTGGTVVAAQGLALDYGVSGNGFHEVNAIDGANGVNSPYAQTVTWSSTPTGANPTFTVQSRIGNLYGITGVAGEYGMYAGNGWGKTDGTAAYVKAGSAGVDLQGVDLTMWDGANKVILLARNAGAPYLSVGNPAPTAFSSGAGVWMGKDGANGYKFRVGDPSGAWMSYSPAVSEGLRIMSGANVRAQFKGDGSGSLANGNIAWDTAGNADIAGWKVYAGYLYSAAGSGVGMAPGDYPFFAGSTYAGRASAAFRVDTAGNIYAGSATLGGNLTFGTTGFVASAGNTWGSGTGVWMGYNGAAYKFRVGATGGQRLEWDGSNLQLYGSTFSLTSSGGLSFGRSGNEGGDSNTIRWSDGNIMGGNNSYTWIGGPGSCCNSAMNIKLSGSQIDLNAGTVNLLKAYSGRVSIYQEIGYNPPSGSSSTDVLVTESSSIRYRPFGDVVYAYGGRNAEFGVNDQGCGSGRRTLYFVNGILSSTYCQ